MTDALLYARVSTTDKDQDPDTQLFPLREYCGANDWHVAGEYVDRASARDLAHRKDWRKLLDHCSRRRGKFVVVVFKLDRAFRSVKDMHDTLATWELQGIEFRSIREQFDTGTAVGRLLLNMLAAVAEFELEMIRERVKAGMDRARRQGKKIGRPSVMDRRGFRKRFGAILERLKTAEISRREAAKELDIGYATLKRLFDAQNSKGSSDG